MLGQLPCYEGGLPLHQMKQLLSLLLKLPGASC
jgi:hypothetical protein